MNYSVYLRPLEIKDAEISHTWRNNPEVWKYTGSRPDRHVTLEMEQQWIADVQQRKNEKRFAVCVPKGDKYIGNAFLTNITEKDAEIHLFIGDVYYWGKGQAYDALVKMLAYSFQELKLETLYCDINVEHLKSRALVKRVGFKEGAASIRQPGNVKFVRQEINQELFDKHNLAKGKPHDNE